MPVASQHISITRIFPSCLHQKPIQLHMQMSTLRTKTHKITTE